MKKILTVIIPSYNMEHYLPKCLGSLIVDDPDRLQKLDVIVVNDGSKDQTSEIAHVFVAKYPGVFRVVDKQNGHYGSCINAALEVASGKYVRVLDADDYFHPENFESYLRWLADVDVRWSPDALVSDFCYVDVDARIKSTTHYGFPEDRVFTPNESLDFTRVNIGIHAVAYRTDILREIGYRQSEGLPYTDTEWSILPMRKVSRMAYFPKTVKCYLEGREGQTMCPEQLRANAEKYVTVAKHILEEYAAQGYDAIDGVGTYARFFISELYKWMLSLYLLEESGGVMEKCIARDFDACLHRCARDVYDSAAEFSASKLNFHYVKSLRTHDYDGSSFPFRCYRLYQSIVKCVKSVRGIIR